MQQQYETYKPTGQTDDFPVVEFFNDAREDKAATLKQGIAMFRDVEMVRIRFPADRNRTVVRPAHSEWKKVEGRKVTYAMRFNEQYKRFKAGQAPVVHGTPLSEVPFLTESQRRMLRALDIYTAQQLAGLEGQALKNLGLGGRDLQTQAKAFLGAATGTADVVRLATDNQHLKDRIAQLEAAQRGGSFPEAVIAAGDAQKLGTEQTDVEALSYQALLDHVSEISGQSVKGRPSKENLLRMARDLQGKAAA